MTIAAAELNRREREPLPALSMLTIGALLGAGLAFGALALTTGAFNVPLVVQAAVALAAGAAILARFRWAPLVGGVVGAAALVATGVVPVARAYASYHLSHPAEVTAFTVTLVRIVCLSVAAAAGIGAWVQNSRVADPGARRAPSWTGIALGVLAGTVAGAVLVSALVAASGPGPGAAGNAGGARDVHLGPNTFTPAVVDVPAGGSIFLIEDAPIPHFVRNGQWAAARAAQAAREPGAPAVNVVITNGAVQVGPFSRAGVYHLYCTVHPGMNLTLRIR